jgi:hypothetical protein
MIMKTELCDARLINEGLYRLGSEPDEDLSWHEIGPRDHMRANFNHIDLLGYATVGRGNYDEKTRRSGPPYYVYACFEWRGVTPSKEKHYATEAAAKRACRAWITQWLRDANPEPLIWEMGDSGFHFSAYVPDGPLVGGYYLCENATKHWHKGFRVGFGGTYYTTKFAGPDEARAAVQRTYERWLAVAQARLVKGG